MVNWTFNKMILAFFATFLLICGGLYALGAAGYCDNYIYESIAGNGSINHQSYTGTSSDKVIVQNADQFTYSESQDYAANGQTTFLSNFMVKGAKGKLWDQYQVTSESAGIVHTFHATKIAGDFQGSANMVTMHDSLSSLILMNGNATYHGEITDISGKHPITRSVTDSEGTQIIESYVQWNITHPNDDWLSFCASWNGISPQPPDGLYIRPMTTPDSSKLPAPQNESLVV